MLSAVAVTNCVQIRHSLDTSMATTKSKAKYGSVKVTDRNGKIYLDFRVNGQRFRPALNLETTRQNLGLAETIANQITQDIALGQFDESLEKYLPSNKVGQHKTTLIDVIKSYIEVNQFVSNDYKRTVNWLIQNKVTIDNIADKLTRIEGDETYNRRLKQLTGGVLWGIQRGMLKTNPLLDSRKRKRSQSTEETDKRKPFTTQEWEAILEAFRDDTYCPVTSNTKHSYYLDYVFVLALTGCRMGEINGLKVKHVDLVRNEIEICESLSRDSLSGKRSQKSTKTGSVKFIPMNDQLREVMVRWTKDKSPDAYVFTGPKGKPIDDHNWNRRIWKPILEGLGIPYRVPYALRHSFGSRAIEQGMALTSVAYLMGHSNPRMLIERYGHMINRPSLPSL